MNYQYFGLFLDEPTRNKLMQVIIGNPIICNLVFQRGSTIYLDHCTLLHKNQHEEKMANDLQYRIDGNFRLIVNKIGISEKAIAFGVELGDQYLPCANAMTINENMVGRPSRIRYVKEFGNLDLKVVNEYLDDALQVPEARQDLLDFIDSLTISTIDILKTIVNEVNIHGIEGLRRAKSFFNVVTNEYDYSCVKGYAYAYEISADKSKFSIEEFSKAVERFNNPIPKPIVDDEDNCTVEERKALNEYYEYRRHNFHSLSYFYVSSDIKFANLSVGDDFYGEEIIAIDKKLGIVVTKENNEVNYYWVKDPNSKPSLYRRGTYNSLVL